jgi:hypothetical protein
MPLGTNRNDLSYFDCPQCGSDAIEEVCSALQYSMICAFYQGHEDYCETNTEGLDIIRYQCYECQFEVCEGSTQMSLYRYLKSKGWLRFEGDTPLADTSDWEA